MSDFDHAIEEARRLAGTPEGQQMIRILQELGGTDLQKSMDAAAAGDFHQARQTIAALMNDPQARQILSRLGGGHGK